jgi:proline iminopeptidase
LQYVIEGDGSPILVIGSALYDERVFSREIRSLWEGLTTNMQMFDYVWCCVFRDIDITKGLENFDKPVFLVLGRYDYLTGPPELWNNIKPHFRNLTETIFEQSAHCPQYEQPEEFNEALLKWRHSLLQV